jgi:hypothetical protein
MSLLSIFWLDPSNYNLSNNGIAVWTQPLETKGNAFEQQQQQQRTVPTTSSKFPRICNVVRRRPLHQLWYEHLLPDLFSKLLADGEEPISNPTIREWYTLALKDTFSFRDWKKTILHPPDIEGFQQILTLLEQKMQNPKENPPVRVVVYGGSVTAGVDSEQSAKFRGLKCNSCAWASMLQEASNHILGPGVVSVSNLAIAAGQSAASVNLMEMGLWPEDYPPEVTPDIVIWGHAINDHYLFPEDRLRSSIRDFHMAARQTRCDVGLPLVIYVNEAAGHGRGPMASLHVPRVAGVLNELISWFGVMGVAVDRLWLAYAFSNTDRAVFELSDRVAGSLPLLDMPKGWGFRHHGGILMHATIAYAIVFNLLSATVDTCIDEEETASLSRDQSPDASRNFTLILSRAHMPPLKSEFQKREIHQQWEQSVVDHENRCRNTTAAQEANSKKKCSYAWINYEEGTGNLASGVKSPDELEQRMQAILVHNEGWSSAKRNDKDKIGWNALKQGATFTAKIRAGFRGVRHLRLAVMESYSADFAGASVKLTLSVETTDGDSSSSSSSVIHFVSGHNIQDKTSPVVPHKLDLPPVQSANDTLLMQFDLAGGKTFKIMGMALCIS